MLLEEAAHHDARDLRRPGKRILDVIDPEAGEAHEAKLLAAEEAKAAASARLTKVDRFDFALVARASGTGMRLSPTSQR